MNNLLVLNWFPLSYFMQSRKQCLPLDTLHAEEKGREKNAGERGGGKRIKKKKQRNKKVEMGIW